MELIPKLIFILASETRLEMVTLSFIILYSLLPDMYYRLAKKR